MSECAQKLTTKTRRHQENFALGKPAMIFFSRAVLVWSDSRNISPARLTTKTQRHEESVYDLAIDLA
jgi:hypothetical protein